MLMIQSNIIQMRLTRSYGFSGVFKEIADFHIVRVNFRPAVLGAVTTDPRHLCKIKTHMPQAGLK